MIVGSPTILNLVPGGVMKCVHVNQVNKNIEIQFKVMNGAAPYNVPEGVTCTIRGTKGDAFGYAAEAAVTAGSNVITVTLTEQLTAVAGAGNIFELVFVGAADDMKASTENFILAVERQAMGEDTVISDSDLSYAEQVLDQLQNVAAVNAQVQQNKSNLAAEISRAKAAEAAETAARQAADNTLQSNINAEASTRAAQDASLQSQINQLVAPEGSAPSAAEVENARVGADGTVYPTLGDAIRTQDTQLKSQIDEIVEQYQDYHGYFYKHDTAILVQNGEVTANGCDLYKIPVNSGDVVLIKFFAWAWPDGLTRDARVVVQLTDNSYSVGIVYLGRQFNTSGASYIVLSHSDIKNVFFCVKNDYTDKIHIFRNNIGLRLNDNSVHDTNVVYNPTKCSYKTHIYAQAADPFRYYELSGVYAAYCFRLSKGDKLIVSSEKVLNLYGTKRKLSDNTTTNLNDANFTADTDYLISLLCTDTTDPVAVVYPSDSLKIDASNVLNLPSVEIPNPYDNLTGVAFGTSLTYRSQTTGGYLSTLETLSGITFDNQGLGSSTILAREGSPQMLPVIQNYSGWAGKRVCLLEGFCNDWYYNGGLLGTWKDTGTATVCGCVRTALTHILTQNPNLTVFLILDHFGKGITAPSAVNSENETQFEWYEELAKLGRSMGIRVIREYELSEISNLTPQYLLDNIHLNALGAEQSAKAIWTGMKGTYPNLTA